MARRKRTSRSGNRNERRSASADRSTADPPPARHDRRAQYTGAKTPRSVVPSRTRAEAISVIGLESPVISGRPCDRKNNPAGRTTNHAVARHGSRSGFSANASMLAQYRRTCDSTRSAIRGNAAKSQHGKSQTPAEPTYRRDRGRGRIARRRRRAAPLAVRPANRRTYCIADGPRRKRRSALRSMIASVRSPREEGSHPKSA